MLLNLLLVLLITIYYLLFSFYYNLPQFYCKHCLVAYTFPNLCITFLDAGRSINAMFGEVLGLVAVIFTLGVGLLFFSAGFFVSSNSLRTTLRTDRTEGNTRKAKIHFHSRHENSSVLTMAHDQ